ncbi:universal stress protein [Halovenus sp. WSH3]|uniref:Universal stress protein n=1 Tax=Halovenus carboxidivorans TaxID=2692199 RepID=A0A6B0T8L6_9EURY|nr:universal stress protein [Halovenus carboxidivorans]MXR51672.1 universal stress protein [Halovenus carboxidivorans]
MYDRILVAVDGSDHASSAVTHALDLAARHDAVLHALYVVETRTAYDNAIIDPERRRETLREAGERELTEVQDRAETEGVEVRTDIEEGAPPEEILAYIEDHDIDAVCMGERGQSDFKTVLLGSATETVIHETEVPVVVV